MHAQRGVNHSNVKRQDAYGRYKPNDKVACWKARYPHFGSCAFSKPAPGSEKNWLYHYVDSNDCVRNSDCLV